MHEGKTFECAMCDQQFTTKTHLKVHVNSAHKNIRYPSEICPFPGKSEKS